MKLQTKVLEHSLTALSENKYSQWDIHKCVEYTIWLKRFKHINEEVYDIYFKYIMYILNGEYEDFVSTHSFGGK